MTRHPVSRTLLRAIPLLCAIAGAPAYGQTNFTETVLYNFGGADGEGPRWGVIADAAGNLYGTTIFGGVGGGTVFELVHGQSGYAQSLVYNFTGNDGALPSGGLVAGPDGALYGVTANGGAFNQGVVYKLTPGGSGYSESVLYSFQGGNTDGAWPWGTPVLGKDGTIYGITQFGAGGGGEGNGIVFALTSSNGRYVETILHRFAGGADGFNPQSGLAIDRHGTLFGTTAYGGNMAGCQGSGCGTVFALTPSKSGFTHTVLYAFQDEPDGTNPAGALTLDKTTGALFGTTTYGGTDTNGTVFELMPSGSGYSESVLHSFGSHDGFEAEGQLLLVGDRLYGTTALGAGGCRGIGCGSVFRLEPTGAGYAFKTIYHFRDPANGAEPATTALTADASGALYGTTLSGGTRTHCYDGGPGGAVGCGVVFKLARAKN
jgi:uncharacterized repeat protein (TIGR03803 family)